MQRLIDIIRSPDPVPFAFGRHAIRLAIRQAFDIVAARSGEVSSDAPIFSQDKMIDVLIKRYHSYAVGNAAVGLPLILDDHVEEQVQQKSWKDELQSILYWYETIIPWIVKIEFF